MCVRTHAGQKWDGEPHCANNIEHIGVGKRSYEGLYCVLSPHHCLNSLKQEQHKDNPLEKTGVFWECDVVQIYMDESGRYTFKSDHYCKKFTHSLAPLRFQIISNLP